MNGKSRILIALTLSAICAGCAGGGRREASAEDRLTSAERKIAAMGDLYAAARDRINQIEKRNSAEVLSLKERILLLEARPVAGIPTQTPTASATPSVPEKTDPSVAPVPPVTPPASPTPPDQSPQTLPSPAIDPAGEELAASAVRQLREGKEGREVAMEIFARCKEVLPHLFRILRETREAKEHELSEKIERLLATLPPADLKPHLEIALAKPELRTSAVAVVGGSGDAGLGAMLEPLTAEGDADERFSVAESLVRCKNKKGIPILIETLKADGYNRIIAFDILKRLTGQSFGYRPSDAVDANAGAVAEWEKWWENFGKDFQIE